MERSDTKAIIFVAVVVAIIIAVTLIGFMREAGKADEQTRGCPNDAKVCPDGTTVGRVLPNCEFARCPDSRP